MHKDGVSKSALLRKEKLRYSIIPLRIVVWLATVWGKKACNLVSCHLNMIREIASQNAALKKKNNI